MNQSRRSELRRINYLGSELNALYHQSSLKLGITDSVSIVLYTIHDAGERCLLSDIYKQSGINKQTVNSAIRSLETNGIVYLEPSAGRGKIVILTGKGKSYIAKTVARLFEAEAKAFDSWPEKDISTYIQLMEKYVCCFRRQVNELEPERDRNKLTIPFCDANPPNNR